MLSSFKLYVEHEKSFITSGPGIDPITFRILGQVHVKASQLI